MLNWLLLSCCWLLTLTCLAQPAAARKPPSKLDSIAAFVQSEMKARGIPGLQLAIIRSGKVLMQASYGLANVEHNVPVTSQTLFSINSATKAFTGVAAMQLVEEGKLDLSQPLARYLPDLPAAWQPIPVRRLLDHTSGLPDFVDVKNGGYRDGLPFDKAWVRIRQEPLEFLPGEKTSYNQTNYVLLGQLIERLSGTSFEQFVRVRQFGPAGMALATFGDSRDVTPNKAPTYAHSRQTKGNFVKGQTLERTWEEFPELRSTAGINTTAAELAKWLLALQSHRLLTKQNSLDALWTPQKLNNNAVGGWALGWTAKRNLAPRAVAGIGGSRSWFYVYPDHDLAVVVLTNMKSDGPENLASEIAGFFYPVLKAVNGGNYPDTISPLRTVLERKGYAEAVGHYQALKASNPAYSLSERDLTNWAYYELLIYHQLAKAEALFQLTAYLYPASTEAKEGLEDVRKAAGSIPKAP